MIGSLFLVQPAFSNMVRRYMALAPLRGVVSSHSLPTSCHCQQFLWFSSPCVLFSSYSLSLVFTSVASVSFFLSVDPKLQNYVVWSHLFTVQCREAGSHPLRFEGIIDCIVDSGRPWDPVTGEHCIWCEGSTVGRNSSTNLDSSQAL